MKLIKYNGNGGFRWAKELPPNVVLRATMVFTDEHSKRYTVLLARCNDGGFSTLSLFLHRGQIRTAIQSPSATIVQLIAIIAKSLELCLPLPS